MQRRRFDQEWRFHLGDIPEGRWREPDDSTWRLVDLPHDWSIELERDPANPSGSAGGYFPMGLGWYRKTFAAPEAWRGNKVRVEFEGVYMSAEAWLNGHFLGRHPYGYTSFWYDLTPYLDVGATNVLKVMVDNACQVNSRWYSGSGIYRHVWLMVAEPVHVGQWGISVTTPEVSPEEAIVRVRTTVENEPAPSLPSGAEGTYEVIIRSRVVAPDGTMVGTSEARAAIAPGGRHEYSQDVQVANPQLWSPDTPHLYHVETEVLVEDGIVDTATTAFGIRSLHFDAQAGFLLNGQPLKLKGGCVHHDDGVLGAASYDRAEERKVELLKASGFNAVRCAHNPPAPAFLGACDRLGMLVIDEAFDCWRDGKNPYDYHVSFDDWWDRDLDSMLYRDRNHPSVILWSIGNELVERGQPEGARLARLLAEHVRAVDPTRPVTAAINGFGNAVPWSRADETFAALDVGGYNYQWGQYRPDHEQHPQRMMIGTESTPREAFDHWMSVLELDYVLGDFVWTALDYLGEAGIGRVVFEGEQEPFLGRYPWHQANCGDLDLCGFKRPQSYYRDVLWQTGTNLYIAVHTPIPEGKKPVLTYWGWPDVWPDWTWPGREGQPFQVDVYAACEQVELFLNGRSLGVQPATRQERFLATFQVPYEPGILKAVGYTGGRSVVECEVRTVGAPVGIRLTPDRSTIQAEPGDLSFVTVEIVDGEGLVHPHAGHTVFFTVKGEGSIAAVGSGDPLSVEGYRGNQRKAYRGRCLVVVKSRGTPGEIHLRAQADGLDGAEVVIRAT
ncbi:MAG TPA: glycoside hydrolase family 2 TIM barrel-domain containing protein [Anaerolineae bacterium]|nr:glycoside hydrolase family 2 TIM barrel-domain containing protein [Anaerolineae bacterium]